MAEQKTASGNAEPLLRQSRSQKHHRSETKTKSHRKYSHQCCKADKLEYQARLTEENDSSKALKKHTGKSRIGLSVAIHRKLKRKGNRAERSAQTIDMVSEKIPGITETESISAARKSRIPHRRPSIQLDARNMGYPLRKKEDV